MHLYTPLLSGVAAHVLVFRHGEWDLLSPHLCASYISLTAAAGVADLLYSYNHHLFTGNLSLCVLFHLVGIVSSMLVYRLAFHRLRTFPGPFWARASNFYMMYLSAQNSQFHEELARLHAEYGDFVRLGPNQLFIADPKAVRAIHSASSKTMKGPGYVVLEPRISLSALRDTSAYSARRRVWDKAFQVGALRNYEPRIQKYADQLLAVLERTSGSPVEVNQWFNFFAFDVMGDLSFGKSFDMLVHGRESYLLQTIRQDRAAVGLLGLVPWVFPIFQRTPGLNQEYLKMWDWVGEQVRERERCEPASPDVFSWVLEDYESQGDQSRQARLNLDGDAYMLVIAGSETTSITLTNIFFHLAYDSRVTTALRDSLLTIEDMTFDSLRDCEYLNAVINETLRLYPVVLSGLQRRTPPDGLMVGSTFIPGDVFLQAPQFVIGRDERCFVRGSEFIPERWTSQAELIVDSSSFAPFSIGMHSCVGKQLALMELRWVVARIVLTFNVKLANDQDAKSFMSGTQDFFTALPSPLSLVFTKRDEQ